MGLEIFPLLLCLKFPRKFIIKQVEIFTTGGTNTIQSVLRLKCPIEYYRLTRDLTLKGSS